MGLRARRGLVVVVTLLLLVLPLSSVALAATDYASTGAGATDGGSSYTNPNNASDSDDSTAATYSGLVNSCTSFGDTYDGIKRTTFSGTHAIGFIRVKVTIPCRGSASKVRVFCGASTLDIAITSSTFDTGMYALTGSFLTACSAISAIRFDVYSDGCGSSSCTISLFSAEAWDAAPPVTGTITDYVRGLEAHPTLAGYSFSWYWAKSFTGHYTLHDDGCSAMVVSSSTGLSLVSGAKVTVPQTQPTGCSSWLPTWSGTAWTGGPGPWTLTVTDEAGSTTVSTYTIPENANGTLIPGVVVPAWEYVTGCFEAHGANTDCTGSVGVGEIDFTYRIALGDPLDRADIVIGPRDYSGGITSNVVTRNGAAGSTTYTNSVTGQSSGDWMACATNVAGTVCLPFAVPAAGGKFGATTGVHTGTECAATDVGCFIREMKDQLGDMVGTVLRAMFIPSDAGVARWMAFSNELQLHEPTATMYAVATVIGSWATHSTSSTACLTQNLHMDPTHIGNTQTVNYCLDIVTSHTEFATIRALEGWVVYGLFALKFWGIFASGGAASRVFVDPLGDLYHEGASLDPT